MDEFNKYARLDEICTHGVLLFQQIKRENPYAKFFCTTERYALNDYHSQVFYGIFSLYRAVMKDSYDFHIYNVSFKEKMSLMRWHHWKIVKKHCFIIKEKEKKNFKWEDYAKVSMIWFFDKLKENAKATDEEIKILKESYYV